MSTKTTQLRAYFDLNIHPLAKNQLSSNSNENLEKPIVLSKDFRDYTNEVVLRRLESQGSINQMKQGRVLNGVASIGSVEYGVASSKGFLNNVLKSKFNKPVDEKYFESIREGEVSYFRLFLKNIQQYFNLREEEKINLLNRINFEGIKSDNVKLFFAIDGGYNLCMKKIGNALIEDVFKKPEENKKDDNAKNAEKDNSGKEQAKIEKEAEEKEKVEKEKDENLLFNPSDMESKCPSNVLERLVGEIRGKDGEVLYLTLAQLTHIPEQHLATHAYGAKILKHPSFFPCGHGLTELGKKVIEKAYTLTANAEPNNESKDNAEPTGKKSKLAPVYIDITHLSLKSREDLYDFRINGNINFSDKPLIASHVSVTGYSIKDWKDNLIVEKCQNHIEQGIKTVKIYTRPKVAAYWGGGTKQEFAFNPSTINLMDEDIIEIAKSGGLIGLSFDVSLLGNTTESLNEEETCEFLSTADFTHYFPYSSVKTMDYTNREQLRAEESWLLPNKKETHPLNLCLNVIHIVAVINLKADGKTKERAEKTICIGSNFDGLIEPLRACENSIDFKNLKACLMRWLPVAAKRYLKVNGGTKDSFKFVNTIERLETFVDGILIKNAFEFIANHFPYKDSSKETSGVATTSA
ncbi:hypothetical protein [uncultured Zobellia sp.]|uniref:hypothetical protein n=1 Tax=uncultured Zobellia sp. TaxID=255433 RepID=UPI002596BE24|nr:hypothetical protein [uncultured Zobellia sp.]